MAKLIFSRENNRMYLLDNDGYLLTPWSAANNTTADGDPPRQRNANPCEIQTGADSNTGCGPAPHGTWTIMPEFNWGSNLGVEPTPSSRDASSPAHWPGFSGLGDAWDDKNYRIRLGGYGDVINDRGIFIHDGGDDYEAETDGCIRMGTDDIRDLVEQMCEMRARGDRVDSITIMPDGEIPAFEDSGDGRMVIAYPSDDIENQCEEPPPPEDGGTSYGGGRRVIREKENKKK